MSFQCGPSVFLEKSRPRKVRFKSADFQHEPLLLSAHSLSSSQCFSLRNSQARPVECPSFFFHPRSDARVRSAADALRRCGCAFGAGARSARLSGARRGARHSGRDGPNDGLRLGCRAPLPHDGVSFNAPLRRPKRRNALRPLSSLLRNAAGAARERSPFAALAGAPHGRHKPQPR